MISWIDQSDKNSRFFVSESDLETDGEAFIAHINELFDFLLTDIIGKEPKGFDTVFLEINCDTGRMIISPSTEEGRQSGILNGCSVRYPKLQDFWYDLDESDVSDDEFNIGIKQEVTRIGLHFKGVMEKYADKLIDIAKGDVIFLIVYGNDPEIVIVKESFSL